VSRSRVGSLGRRLSAWLALQSLAGLAVVCAAVYAVTALSFQARQQETLLQKEAQLRHLLSEAAGGLDAAALRHKLDDFLIGHQDLSLRLQRPDGSAFYDSASRPAAASGRRELHFAMLMPAAGEARLQATLSLDARDDQRLLRRVAMTLLAAALAGAVVVSAGGFVLVRLGLRPLRDLVEQTRQLAADTLHRRLDGSAQPEELEPLIAQFNELLGHLAQAYEQLEGFNADVAHELCTPLATLIASTELALRKARSADELREVLGANLEDLQRIAGIVQDMLFLSQADRGALARREPVQSLAALAAQIADYHEASLAEAALGLVIRGDARGDFDVPLLHRALSNLLDNATRHAERGSVLRIEIAAVQHEVSLLVVNRGATIAPEDLPRLFDRFFRADRSRSDAQRNHGLGLAIVAAIARMHGGRPLAHSAGGETTVGLRLRASAPEPQALHPAAEPG
jgi:two-component system heavy metal sensor histidine kinase CusS